MAAQKENLESALLRLNIASVRAWCESAGLRPHTVFASRWRGGQLRLHNLEALGRVAGVPPYVVDAILKLPSTRTERAK